MKIELSKLLDITKSFLGFAKEAAPIAAEIAKQTGHADVVSDIEKAGAAADMASKVVEK